MIISRSILLRIRNVSDKSCRQNQNTHFVFSNFCRNLAVWDNVEKYCKALAGHRWQHDACTLRAGYLRLHTHTLTHTHPNTHPHTHTHTPTHIHTPNTHIHTPHTHTHTHTHNLHTHTHTHTHTPHTHIHTPTHTHTLSISLSFSLGIHGNYMTFPSFWSCLFTGFSP